MRHVMIRLVVLGWLLFASWGGVQECGPGAAGARRGWR